MTHFTKAILIIVLITNCNLLLAQYVQFKPAIPEAGRPLQLHYTPPRDFVEKELNAYIYALTDQAPTLIDGKLIRKGKALKGTVNIPKDAKALYIYFYHDNFIDNNFQQGYTAVTRGNEASGNIRLLAEKINNERSWSPNSYFPDLDISIRQYKELYENKWGVNEWISYYDIKNYYDEDFNLEERMEILKRLLENQLHQYEAQNLKSRFVALGENSFNKKLDSIIGPNEKIKTPLQIQISRSVSQAHPAHRKLLQFNKYYDTLSNKKYKEEFTNELAAQVIKQYISEEKEDSALLILKKINSSSLNSEFGNIVVHEITKKISTNTSLEKKLDNFIEIVKSEPIERHPFENLNQFNYRKRASIERSKLLTATKELARENKSNALNIYKEVFKNNILPLNSYANNFINLLNEAKEYPLLEEVWRNSYFQNMNSTAFDKLIQELIPKNVFSFNNFEEEKKKISQELILQEATKISQKLSKIKAPSFQLVDKSGKIVKLEDYRGKKLMIDFWATWCTFCKASFPEIKQIQNYFSEKDPNIEFLFIQTMERGNQEEKKKEGYEYLTQHDLPFYSLFDNREDSYSKKYYLNSIPAKIFIDSNGNFVYKSIGYKAGYEKNLAEFIALFNAMD